MRQSLQPVEFSPAGQGPRSQATQRVDKPSGQKQPMLMRRILIEPAREAMVSNKWTYCPESLLSRSLQNDRGNHFRPQERACIPVRLPRERLLTVRVEYRYGS